MYKIQEELKEWAEETYNFYLPLASKLNMDFYTQSKLTDITDDKPVELMVIGINPGHGGTFLKDRFEKSEDLLLGNTYKGKHETIQKWRILTNLRSILDFAGLGSMLDNESQFVFTNATFFSTHDENDLVGKEIKSAQLESIQYTKKLIEKIHPKHIICLGGKNCTDLIVENTKPLLSDLVKLDYGVIGDIPVYGINHTSSFWSSEEMELVGKAAG